MVSVASLSTRKAYVLPFTVSSAPSPQGCYTWGFRWFDGGEWIVPLYCRLFLLSLFSCTTSLLFADQFFQYIFFLVFLLVDSSYSNVPTWSALCFIVPYPVRELLYGQISIKWFDRQHASHPSRRISLSDRPVTDVYAHNSYRSSLLSAHSSPLRSLVASVRYPWHHLVRQSLWQQFSVSKSSSSFLQQLRIVLANGHMMFFCQKWVVSLAPLAFMRAWTSSG